MSLGANNKVILAATRELARKWDETKHSWRDAKAEEFEREYLAELFSQVERTVPIMEELDKLIASARNQCE